MMPRLKIGFFNMASLIIGVLVLLLISFCDTKKHPPKYFLEDFSDVSCKPFTDYNNSTHGVIISTEGFFK